MGDNGGDEGKPVLVQKGNTSERLPQRKKRLWGESVGKENVENVPEATEAARPRRMITRNFESISRESSRTEIRELLQEVRRGVKEAAKSSPELIKVEPVVAQLSMDLECLFTGTDTTVDCAGDQARLKLRESVRRIETGITSLAKYIISVHEVLHRLQRRVDELEREADAMRLKARYNVWHMIFHMIVCFVLRELGNPSGARYSFLRDDLSFESVNTTGDKWKEPLHQDVLAALGIKGIVEFQVTEVDFEQSMDDRENRNYKLHGERNENDINGQNVDSHYKSDMAELETLKVSSEEKEYIKRIMACVRSALKKGFMRGNK